MNDSSVLPHWPPSIAGPRTRGRGGDPPRAALSHPSHGISKQIETIGHLAHLPCPRVSDMFGKLCTLGRLGNAKMDQRPASATPTPAPPLLSHGEGSGSRRVFPPFPGLMRGVRDR